MSAVKHQPATPLPFEVHEATSTRVGFDIQSAEGAALIAYNLRLSEDAAYIAHAANAYPKLVEALRAAANHINRITNPAANYGEFQEVRTARALLRDLGEAQ